MFEREVMVKNQTGLHARPASMLVSLAGKHKAKTSIKYNGKVVNTRSMLSVLGAGIRKGSVITIAGEGSDEQEAVDALVYLIEQFNE